MFVAQVLTEREGGGEKPQVAEVLRSLLDPEGMEGREQVSCAYPIRAATFVAPR